MTNPSALDRFHPTVRQWFRQRFATPTPVQEEAWRVIAQDRHLLATAPTGSGKTLAAFLWGLDRLFTEGWSPGQVRILYISPLKALNNDIERNLLTPLTDLEAAFRQRDPEAPSIRAATRSGDTPPKERRRLYRQPPEILITTPESLNILLLSESGRFLFRGLKAVILDEIHSVVASKRGTHLITAVDRLTEIAGEFQRIALSATVRPLDRIAQFVGGFRREERGGETFYERRVVEIVNCPTGKTYSLDVEAPFGPPQSQNLAMPAEDFWPRLITSIRRKIARNRSTLIFTRSRRMAEKVTRLLNEEAGETIAWSHHGSLARELRQAVEKRFKAGELSALVATSSLELGIDIGALDEVLMVGTPTEFSSVVQRLGRAGHRVGDTSTGCLYPLYGHDLIAATVVSGMMSNPQIEAMRPIEGALDVLAQVILSRTLGEERSLEDLWNEIRTSDPYHHLPRVHFDLVIKLLTGRYANRRIRELKPRLDFDGINGTVRARKNARLLLLLSGGTIPDRGYFDLRMEGSGAKLGELDEEFVWERSVGDTFTLGAQSWRIRQITHRDVLVVAARSGASFAPFWRAEAQDRSAEFALQVAEFLSSLEALLTHGGSHNEAVFLNQVQEASGLGEDSARALLDFCLSQRTHTDRPLPHRTHLLVERIADSAGPEPQEVTLLHTLWGGQVNRPFALALKTAWKRRYGSPLEILHDDHCLFLRHQERLEPEEYWQLVDPEELESLIRENLEATGFFGARFRENAGRALLLPRGGPHRRIPLWLNRLRAKELFESVVDASDFPLVLETWRTLLHEFLDLQSLALRLEEIQSGEVAFSVAHCTRPSPFASHLDWKVTNERMYEGDGADGPRRTSLQSRLIKDLIARGQAPLLSPRLVGQLEEKLQRTAPGWSPPPLELGVWVKERIAIPRCEFNGLVEAIRRDHEVTEVEVDESLQGLWVVGDEDFSLVVHAQNLDRVAGLKGLKAEDLVIRPLAPGESSADLPLIFERLRQQALEPVSLEDTLADWLGFYGPVSPYWLADTWSLPREALISAAEALVDEGQVLFEPLLEGQSDAQLCDLENYSRLLRLRRREAQPSLEPLPLDNLPLFLAHHQGLNRPGAGLEALQHRLEPLLGWSAPAAAWEESLLPARLDPYYLHDLDALFSDSDLQWVGVGDQRLTFLIGEDREVVRPPRESSESPPLMEEPGLRYPFQELARLANLTSEKLTERLWADVWRGEITNDGFHALRKGLGTGFKATQLPEKPSRRSFDRWRSSRAFGGSWYRLSEIPETEDLLDRADRLQEAIRLILQRYGVVFRELLLRELPSLHWARIFPALRRLELSGEIVSGHFFLGLSGVQFATKAAVNRLKRGLERDIIFWISTLDPVAPCGLGLGEFTDLPGRRPGGHLVYHGPRLVIASRRHGEELTINVGPDHPDLSNYFLFLKVMLTRAFNPKRYLILKTINGIAAADSPFASILQSSFSVTKDRHHLRLWRRY